MDALTLRVLERSRALIDHSMETLRATRPYPLDPAGPTLGTSGPARTGPDAAPARVKRRRLHRSLRQLVMINSAAAAEVQAARV